MNVITEKYIELWQLKKVELPETFGTTYECSLFSIAPIYFNELESSKNLVKVIYFSDIGEVSFRFSAVMLSDVDWIKEQLTYYINQGIKSIKKRLER